METEKEIDLEHLYPKPYCVSDGCLAREVYKKDKAKPEIVQVCNFIPFMVSQVTEDNGAELSSRVKVGAIKNGKRLPDVDISHEEFNGMGWITRVWGFGCNIAEGSSTKDKIRFAIQATADKADSVMIYTVTGWKKIDGKYHFLMPDDTAQTVKLPGKMSGYTMKRDYSATDIERSFSLLDCRLAPKEIIYPLVSFAFMSPLNCFLREAGCEPKTVLMLTGKTGSKKSTLAALFLSFFGHFTASTLPLSFKDTANSIMYHAFALKDTLTCIDDFHPSGRQDEFNMTSTAQVIMRAYGDRVGRGKLNARSDPMETRYPQGNAIVTAEFAPDIGESGTARYIAVEMNTDSLDIDSLSAYQEEAARGTFNACMFAYTEWLRETFLCDAEKEKEFKKYLHKLFTDKRDEMIKRLAENHVNFHPRIPEDTSVMRIGFKLFLKFLLVKNIIDDDLYQLFLLEFDDVMYALAVAQCRSVEQDKPVYKFICKINALLESGRYFVAQKDRGRVDRNLSCLGYEDDKSFYFFKSLSHSAVKKLCDEQGELFSISENALSKQLIAENIVVPGKNQITKNVRLGDDTTVKLMEIPKDVMRSIVEKYS